MCDEGGYEVSTPTATSDRVCACGTVRSGDQYQTRAPSNTVDSQGAAWRNTRQGDTLSTHTNLGADGKVSHVRELWILRRGLLPVVRRDISRSQRRDERFPIRGHEHERPSVRYSLRRLVGHRSRARRVVVRTL